jgi:phosphohistidine phosphatase
MILYIVRHAWANHPDWADDFSRPLTDEGRARFARIVEKLAEHDFAPELLLTSPLARCRQTAELIAQRLSKKSKKVEVVPRDELQPGSHLRELVQWTAEHAAHCQEVAWVGHAPDVSLMTAALIGEGKSSLAMAKGAVAAIRFEALPEIGGGELKWLATAKLLGC